MKCILAARRYFLCKDSKFIQDSFNHIIGYHIPTIIYDDHQKDNEIKHKTLSDETKWQPKNTIYFIDYQQTRCPEFSFDEIADHSNIQRREIVEKWQHFKIIIRSFGLL